MQKYLIIILTFFNVLINAQNASEDFKNINEFYASNKSLSMNATYMAYKNHFSKEPLSVKNGIFKRNDKFQYSCIGPIETIKNEEYYMFINHEIKNIFISKQSITDEGQNNILGVSIDEMLKLYEKIEYTEISDVQACYTMTFPSWEYSKIQVYFNKKKYYLERIILYYKTPQNLLSDDESDKEPPRLEITYSNLNIKPKFNVSTFTYDNYLVNKNGKLYCKEKYKDYELYDQISSK